MIRGQIYTCLGRWCDMWCTQEVSCSSSPGPPTNCLAFVEKAQSAWPVNLFPPSLFAFSETPLQAPTGNLSAPVLSLLDTCIHALWEIPFNMQIKCTRSTHSESRFQVHDWGYKWDTTNSLNLHRNPCLVGGTLSSTLLFLEGGKIK